MIKVDTAFDAVVNEISELTGLDKALVRKKVWAEALGNGVNVCEEARHYKITPHIYDERMEALYREGYGFIFETMVEGCRHLKHSVQQVLSQRIRAYKERIGVEPVKVLMLGDGCGSDSLYLAATFGEHIDLWYFDVGASRTYEFAQKRFQKHGIPIHFISDPSALPEAFFDVVVCFEVLEHLPDPHEGIATIERVLTIGGVALVTESFSSILPPYPTHLISNRRYSGRTAFMFLRHNLYMTFVNNNDPRLIFRPTEYTRLRRCGAREKIALATNRYAIRGLLSGTFWRMKRAIGEKL